MIPAGPLEQAGYGPNVTREIRERLRENQKRLRARMRERAKARAIARKAKNERRRSRMRVLVANRYAARGTTELLGKHRMAGDTDFSLMARMTGLTPKELAQVMALHVKTLYRWHGAPVFDWPAQFLRTYLWAKKMEAALIDRGVDTEAMKPVLDQPYLKNGRYPRKDPEPAGT